jgi:lipoyl(octanoyl) transferase
MQTTPSPVGAGRRGYDGAMTATIAKILKVGRIDYALAYSRMHAFTESRKDGTPDEIWLVEHDPVFTQGLAGRAEHVHDAGGLPVLQSNRGGQVTYHGPGQVVAYALIDLRRAGLTVKAYVFRLEEALLRTLTSLGVTGHRVRGAPGIYVRLNDPFGHAALPLSDTAVPSFDGLGKIAALGVKVSRHFTYHGVALNVAMDLSPFDRIDPCGYAGLRTIDLATLGVSADGPAVADRLGDELARLLSA